MAQVTPDAEHLVTAHVAAWNEHEGEFAGIPPTGRDVGLPAMASYRVANGAIREHRTDYDRLEFLNQFELTDEATQQ